MRLIIRRPSRSKSEPTLLVNARLVPSAEVLRQLKSIRDAGRPVRVDCGKSLGAAMLPAGTELPAVDAPHQDLRPSSIVSHTRPSRSTCRYSTIRTTSCGTHL